MINHLRYADDLVIVTPSLRSMQILLSHCDIYADSNDVKFNTKKSKCMLFQPKCLPHAHWLKLTLSNYTLKFVNEHNYLGVTLCTDLSDDSSIEKQCRGLYARGNLILRHFRDCTDDVKALLFNSYCSSFYGSSLWYNFKLRSLRSLKTAYNRIFRLLFKLRGQISVSHCLVNLNMNPFTVVMRKGHFSLRSRIFNSDNRIVKCVATSMFAMNSKLHTLWDLCLHRF
jgi:hypothetical protein